MMAVCCGYTTRESSAATAAGFDISVRNERGDDRTGALCQSGTRESGSRGKSMFMANESITRISAIHKLLRVRSCGRLCEVSPAARASSISPTTSIDARTSIAWSSSCPQRQHNINHRALVTRRSDAWTPR